MLSILRIMRLLLMLLAFALYSSLPRAAGVELHNIAIVPTEEAYELETDIALELNPRLEDVVSRGVPLYFVLEFQLDRPRWYWLDEKISRRSLTYRLSYQALTRQYRLSTGALHQNFPSLDQALRTLTRVRNWSIAERKALEPDEHYQARLRFRLDLARMPKPFQVGAIGDKDWNLATELDWTYVPRVVAPPGEDDR